MMSSISFHGIACRIPYGIGIFFLECDCEMVSGTTRKKTYIDIFFVDIK